MNLASCCASSSAFDFALPDILNVDKWDSPSDSELSVRPGSPKSLRDALMCRSGSDVGLGLLGKFLLPRSGLPASSIFEGETGCWVVADDGCPPVGLCDPSPFVLIPPKIVLVAGFGSELTVVVSVSE